MRLSWAHRERDSASHREGQTGPCSHNSSISFSMREEKKSLKSLLGSKTSIAFGKTSSGVHMLKLVSQIHYFLEQSS